VITALAVICLPIILAFIAFAVDTGLIGLTRTNMQNAVDAASLAASQEIIAAVNEAGEGEDGLDLDANSIAVANARQMAYDVALANGVLINPETDVQFGKRVFDEATGDWPILWGEAPYNVVKVAAYRIEPTETATTVTVTPPGDQPEFTATNAQLGLLFGWAVGKPYVEMTASAISLVDARDIVVVLDFSGSMNDDSELKSISSLGRDAVEANMLDIFEALQPVDTGSLPFEPEYLTVVGQPPGDPDQPQIEVTFQADSIYVESTKDLSNVVLGFDDDTTQQFEDISGYTGTFEGTGDYADKTIVKCWVKSGSNDSGEGPGYGERFDDTYEAVKQAFGLEDTPYPYPSGSWDSLIYHCRTSWSVRNAGYKKKYGTLIWINYLLEQKYKHSRTPDLWKTPHYPFHAVKEGTTLFLDFLDDLDFGDEVGLVSYATTAQREMTLDEDGEYVDITSDPITGDYEAINTIQRHKQAGHYSNMTNMGDGIQKARELLEEQVRYGARPTMLLMTDGNTNQMPDCWTQPDDWDWDELTDYDSDGDADYSTSDINKQYAFWEAKQAIDAGITIHTMSVGANADGSLMEAIAFAGGGIWIEVPGDTTIEEMQDQLLAAFSQIAARVPPAKLVYDDGSSGN
jgi:Flp pilus assembly protein TadG